MKSFIQTSLRPIVLGALTMAAIQAGPIQYGVNWVIDGDAETSIGVNDANSTSLPVGWNSFMGSTLFTPVKYQASPGGFPAFSDPIPPDHGTNFFAGGPNVADAFGIQTFDVSSIASDIDAGGVSFTLSAYLGGFADQNDFSTFSAVFLNGSNLQIGNFAVNGLTALQRGDATRLDFESTTGIIPIGTRTIQFQLEMVFKQGNYDDGYADDASFIAQSSLSTAPSGAPEPSTFLMLGSGLALAGIATWKVRCSA